MEFEQLVKLIQTVSDSALTGFKYEENGVKLSMNKEKTKIVAAGAGSTVPTESLTAQYGAFNEENVQTIAQETGSAAEEKPGKLITSPLVGTFYTAPSEDAEPFVEAGGSVKKGQTIGIVEAMKLMNDIESEYDGTVAEILVTNGEAVEYGQPLFRIV